MPTFRWYNEPQLKLGIENIYLLMKTSQRKRPTRRARKNSKCTLPLSPPSGVSHGQWELLLTSMCDPLHGVLPTRKVHPRLVSRGFFFGRRLGHVDHSHR